MPDSVVDNVAVAVAYDGADAGRPETLIERRARRARERAEARAREAAQQRAVRRAARANEVAERRAARERRRASKAADREASRVAVAERKAARKPANRIAVAVGSAVAGAATLDAEIEALGAGAPDRARDVVLRRLGYREWPPPTLESLGEKYSRTRERVRQIEAARFHTLREVRPTLPLASWAVRILTSLGGVATDEAFRAALAEAGLVASESAARVLPALSDLLLIEPIRFHEHSRCWFDGPRWLELLASGAFDEALNRTLKRARAALRRTGAVSALQLAGVPPLAPAYVANLALEGRPWALHDGYVVRREGSASLLAKTAARVLAAVGEVSLHALRRALRRVQPRPIRLPVAVIAEVLKTRPDFAVANGRVASRVPLDAAALLGPARLAVIEAARQRDGYLTAQEMLAVLSAGGHEPSWTMALIQSPLFERIGRGRYGLVGRFDAVSSAPRSYGRTLARRRYETDGGRVHLRYWVNGISRRGALRLPNRAAVAVAKREGDWELHTGPEDSAPVGTLSLRGGYLFDLSVWLRASGAADGDQIAVILDPPAQHVVVSVVPASDVAREAAAEAAGAEAPAEARRAARDAARDATRRAANIVSRRDRTARPQADPERAAGRAARLAEREQRRAERETRRAAHARRQEERVRLATERTQAREAREAARAAMREAAWNAPPPPRPALPTLALDSVRCYVPGDGADATGAGDVLVAVFGDLAPIPDGALHAVRCRLTVVDRRTRSFAFVPEAVPPGALEALRLIPLDEAIHRVPTLARVLAATYATLG